MSTIRPSSTSSAISARSKANRRGKRSPVGTSSRPKTKAGIDLYLKKSAYAYQHVGLGRLLLNRLVDEAADRGLRALDGHVLYDNQPTLQLRRSSGSPIEVRWDGGDVVSVELEVGRATSMRQRRRQLIGS